MSHSSSPNRRLSSSSSIDEHRRQGSLTSLPDGDDEDADQKTLTADSLIFHQQYSSSSASPPPVSSSKGFDLEQAPPTAFFLRNDHPSQSDSTDDISATFEFQSGRVEELEAAAAATSPTADQPAGLFFDPNPEIIRKPQMIAPIIYKQNITIKFLKPPPIPQGPLIIREVRPPQPPPPPPLVRKSSIQLSSSSISALSFNADHSAATSPTTFATAVDSSRETSRCAVDYHR